MSYQLRFESNAFEADSIIGKMLDGLDAAAKNIQRAAGVKLRQDEVNKLVKLRGVSVRTFERAMDWADNDFDQQMTSEKWKWKEDATTRRKNGQIVSEPRDIVDTGNLLQSKKRDTINASITEFIWEDDVAELVHDGGSLKKGGIYPARPWTEETVNDIENVINTIFRKEAS